MQTLRAWRPRLNSEGGTEQCFALWPIARYASMEAVPQTLAASMEAVAAYAVGRAAASFDVDDGGRWVVHKSGWLEKQGGSRWKGFKRRWCVLLSRSRIAAEDTTAAAAAAAVGGGGVDAGASSFRLLVYYDGPDSQRSNGCICLVDQAYSVSLPKHERTGHPFGIRVDLEPIPGGPEQKLKWIFAATDEDERQSWLAILGESGAALSDKIRVAKQLRVQAAAKLGPAAEKAGWLWKEGKLNKAYKKRWCLLLPPPSYHASGDEYETLNRYLAYYDARDGQKAKGIVALPHRGYHVRRFQREHPDSPLDERAMRLDIVTGPEAGRHYVLSAGSDDDLFSWEMSLLVGAASCPLHVHVPNQRQRLVAESIMQTVGASFDPCDATDVAYLRRFWAAGHTGDLALEDGSGGVPGFVAKGEAWKRWGFQRDDPASDLRAAGRLALRQLVFFLECHPHEATAMAAEQSQRDILVNGYPWAAVGVNVTRLLLMLFDMAAPMGVQTDWRVARRPYWHLLGDGPDSGPFCELYCLAFLVVDKEFNESNGSYLEFGAVMQRARTRLLYLLANCSRDDTVASLWVRALSTEEAAELHAPVHVDEGGAAQRHNPWVHVTHADTRLRATSSAVFQDLLAEPDLSAERRMEIQQLRMARSAQALSAAQLTAERQQFGKLLAAGVGDISDALAAQRAIKEREILRA